MTRKLIKTKRKAVREAYAQYLKTKTARRLSDVYSSFSHAKLLAFQECEKFMESVNGYGLSIVASNSQVFTVGFMAYDDEGECYFIYITPTKVYAMPIFD